MTHTTTQLFLSCRKCINKSLLLCLNLYLTSPEFFSVCISFALVEPSSSLVDMNLYDVSIGTTGELFCLLSVDNNEDLNKSGLMVGGSVGLF